MKKAWPLLKIVNLRVNRALCGDRVWPVLPWCGRRRVEISKKCIIYEIAALYAEAAFWRGGIIIIARKPENDILAS